MTSACAGKVHITALCHSRQACGCGLTGCDFWCTRAGTEPADCAGAGLKRGANRSGSHLGRGREVRPCSAAVVNHEHLAPCGAAVHCPQFLQSQLSGSQARFIWGFRILSSPLIVHEL